MSNGNRMRSLLTRAWSDYLLAAVLCATTLFLRHSLGYEASHSPMLVLFTIPILVTAYLGGLGPGLFATALSGVVSMYFVLPPEGFAIGTAIDLLDWLAMLITGAVTCLLVEALRRAIRRAEDGEERYRIVADNTRDWEFWIDPQGKPLYHSPACLRVTGLDVAVFMVNPNALERLVHPEDLAAFRAHRHGSPNGSKPEHFQFRIVRPDGDVRWIEHHCLPVFDRHGQALGVRGSNSDITESRRMQETLIQTEKMMSVGGLAAGMAHEINNPLSGILQSVQVIQRRLTEASPVNVEAAAKSDCTLEGINAFMIRRGILTHLENIRESGARAARIIAGMLEFSRKDDANLAPVDINGLLDKVLALCAADFTLKDPCGARSIRIRREYDSGLPRPECSATQIQQVVLNILTNASQALTRRPPDSPRGEIALRTSRDGDMVRIEIADNGPGMDEDTRRKIFEPFFTTKPVGEGTGLGLSVSYFIITSNHHGTLDVESAPGQGARFLIGLPLAAGAKA